MMRMSYLSVLSIDPTQQIRYTSHMSGPAFRSWHADPKSAITISATRNASQSSLSGAGKVTISP
jgi:hypothetical protein